MQIRFPIERIHGYVQESFLFGMNGSRKLVKAYVHSLSLYPGCAPSLDLMINEGDGKGSIFMYLPLHSFVTDKGLEYPFEMTTKNHIHTDIQAEQQVYRTLNEYNLPMLAYHNCPEGRVSVYDLGVSKADGNVLCYIKQKDVWIPGKYHVSLDWYDRNASLNLVELADGVLAFLPNHKVKFGHDSPDIFPEYKKLREEWVV